ncbi:MAG: YraN family protein [Candidatus Omnitrophota bacterium]
MAKTNNIAVGKRGEDEAVEFLRRRGYKILERNYRYPEFGEMDIVAKHKGVVCFIEVKKRNSILYAQPHEAVDKKKQFRLSLIALAYLKEKKLMRSRARFDIVSISPQETRLFENAFELNKRFTY